MGCGKTDLLCSCQNKPFFHPTIPLRQGFCYLESSLHSPLPPPLPSARLRNNIFCTLFYICFHTYKIDTYFTIARGASLTYLNQIIRNLNYREGKSKRHALSTFQTQFLTGRKRRRFVAMTHFLFLFVQKNKSLSSTV